MSTPGKLAPSDDRPTCCSRCEEAWRHAQSWPLSLFRAFIVCDICGNKRCPHATDHRLACTGSNEPGQPGSDHGTPDDERLDRSSLRLAVLDQLKLMVAAGADGATCHEITRGLAQRGAVHAENSIARRITSLRNESQIIDTGRTRPGGYPGVVAAGTGGGGIAPMEGATDKAMADTLGVGQSTVGEWRRRGTITSRQADRAAITLGLHPALIWDDWYSEGVA